MRCVGIVEDKKDENKRKQKRNFLCILLQKRQFVLQITL